jgi:hypothetical protein
VRLNAAVAELIREDELDPRVAHEAARLILDQDSDEHELFELTDIERIDDVPVCRQCGKYPAIRGNYGFCGFHRR